MRNNDAFAAISHNVRGEKRSHERKTVPYVSVFCDGNQGGCLEIGPVTPAILSPVLLMPRATP
jgi:hypothetical protein